MYATCVLFFFLHIFEYIDSKFGSMEILYGSYDFHILLLCPKQTFEQGFMPSRSNSTLKFYLYSFGCNFRIQAMFCEQVSSLDSSLRVLLFELHRQSVPSYTLVYFVHVGFDWL
jgi:hypothetical protein